MEKQITTISLGRFKKGEHPSVFTEFKKGMKMPKEVIEKRTKSVLGKKHFFHKKGKEHKNWKGGKPKCEICGKQITSIYAKKCISCLGNSKIGINNPLWKGGKPKCPICKKEISYNAKGCNKHSAPIGKNSYRWIKDRTKLIKRQERNDSAYGDWRLQVYKRDNWKCKIDNQDCSGRIIAHHILGWSDFPELRYQINNGITLCQAHHPLKRAEEKQSIPVFTKLIETKN